MSSSSSEQQPAVPPPLLRPRFEAIPAELRELPRWVVWEAAWDPEKRRWNKVPYDAKRPTLTRKGSSTGAGTWATFEQARRAYEDAGGRYGGVGIVLCDDDDLAGSDLDHAIEGKELTPEALGFLALLNTYTEVSPSGTGTRSFFRATLPPGSRNGPNVEMYESGRFLTVTGRRLAEYPARVEARQAEAEEMHRRVWPPEPPRVKAAKASGDGAPADLADAELLRLAYGAKNNGAKIQALYGGDLSGVPGRSEADLSLCSLLAFYTGPDEARLDRLFRSSDLMRDKWDERHYSDGRTYGQATLRKAIDGCSEFYSPRGVDSETLALQAVRLREGAGPAPSTAGRPENPDDVPAPHFKGEYAHFQVAELLGFGSGVAADTHRAHAERIRQRLGDDIAHCPPLGGWRFWNGKCWQADGREAATLTARVTALSPVVRAEAARLYELAGLLARCERTDDADAMGKAARAHLKHAPKVENTGFARDALHQAAGLLRVEPSRFDPRPWVVGFDNGVWDRGRWREHRREDGMLAVSPVGYDPRADRSEWLALLDRITGGDEDLARTLQDVAGYIFSGASSLRIIPWCYGPRGCGKSTLQELILTALGEMGRTVDPSLFADDASRERLGAAVAGARLVAISEAGNQRIAAEVLKTLSGSDSLPVRRLYAEAYTARPSHVLLLISNDPPRMDAYDEALQERVMTLPLTHPLDRDADGRPAPLTFTGGARVEEVRRDPTSPLVRGFVSWAVEGLARVWEAQTIHRAEVIEEATRRFWKETDPLSDFWEAQDAGELRNGVGKSELRRRYEDWSNAQGVRRPLSPREWARACRARGLVEQRAGDKSGTRHWVLSDASDVTNLFSVNSPAKKKECTGEFSENASVVTEASEGAPDAPAGGKWETEI